MQGVLVSSFGPQATFCDKENDLSVTPYTWFYFQSSLSVARGSLCPLLSMPSCLPKVPDRLFENVPSTWGRHRPTIVKSRIPALLVMTSKPADLQALPGDAELLLCCLNSVEEEKLSSILLGSVAGTEK